MSLDQKNSCWSELTENKSFYMIDKHLLTGIIYGLVNFAHSSLPDSLEEVKSYTLDQLQNYTLFASFCCPHTHYTIREVHAHFLEFWAQYTTSSACDDATHLKAYAMVEDASEYTNLFKNKNASDIFTEVENLQSTKHVNKY